MARTVETWSDFVREPTRVLPKVESGIDVVLRRRDGEPLLLSTKARAESSRLGAELVARVLSEALTEARPAVEKAARAGLAARLPWLRLLPPDALSSFLRELWETFEACASVGNLAQVAVLISDWKATAEVYSDPDLAAELRRPLPRPGSRRVGRPGNVRRRSTQIDHVEQMHPVAGRLGPEHRDLGRRLQDLESHLALTADEEIELRRLRKLKRTARDRVPKVGG